MTAEISHNPTTEKRSKLKAFVGKAKEKTAEGAKWAYAAAGPATLKQVGHEAVGLLRNPPSREKGELTPRLVEAGRRVGNVAIHKLIERGTEELRARVADFPAANRSTMNNEASAQPNPESKQTAEFKTRFVELTDPYLPPSEKPADPRARRLIMGEQPNMQREDGAVRVNIYDDTKTNRLGATIVEHVDVEGSKATRVTEYANFEDGVRVRTTDFIPAGPDQPEKIRSLDPVEEGVFGIPATAEHMQRLEDMTRPDGMAQWQEPRLMPQPGQLA